MKFTNKQDRNLFLEKNIKKDSYGSFALVTYEGKTHSIYFSRYNMEDGPYFLEAPNQLFGIEIPDNVDVNDWVEEYINNVKIYHGENTTNLFAPSIGLLACLLRLLQ